VSSNSRLTVALHALVLLDDPDAEWVSSERIAGSIATNPVVVRRILARLVAAGLVEASKGAAGGYRLARPAARITAWDAYQALREDGPFGLHAGTPNARCPVGRNIGRQLRALYGEAEASMKDSLDGVSIRSLRRSVVVEG